MMQQKIWIKYILSFDSAINLIFYTQFSDSIMLKNFVYQYLSFKINIENVVLYQ